MDPEERHVFAEWGFKSNLSLPLVVDGVVNGPDRHLRRQARRLRRVHRLPQDGRPAAGRSARQGAPARTSRAEQQRAARARRFGARVRRLARARRGAALGGRPHAQPGRRRGVRGLQPRGRRPRHPHLRRPRRAATTRGRRATAPGQRRAARRAIETRQPVAVYDAAADDGLSPEERATSSRRATAASIRLPLIVRGEVVGLVALFDGHAREFARRAAPAGPRPDRRPGDGQRHALPRGSTRAAGGSRSSTRPACSSPRRSSCATSCWRRPNDSARSAAAPTCDLYLLTGADLLCVASVKKGKIVPEWEGTLHPARALGRGRTRRSPARDDRAALVARRSAARRPRDRRAAPLRLRGRARRAAHRQGSGHRRRRAARLESAAVHADTMATVEAVCRAASLAIDNANLFEAVQLRRRETELLNAIARRTASSLAARRDRRGHRRRAAPAHRLRARRPRARRQATGGSTPSTRRTAHAAASRTRRPPRSARRSTTIRDERVVVWEAGTTPSFDGDAGARAPRRRQHRAAARRGADRRAQPHGLPEARLRLGRPAPPGARRHAPRAGHQQRPALRRDQAHAPGQPQGPELGAERQGLLHAGPRRARRRLHGPAGPRARLVRGDDPPGRGGRLPARHRQDRRLRPRPAQAERPELARVGAHAPAPDLLGRHPAAAVCRRPRARRAPPSRALGRLRVSRRPRRRGDPAGGPGDVRGRLLRRHVVPAALPPGPALPRRARRARPLQRRRSSTPSMVARLQARARAASQEQRAEAREVAARGRRARRPASSTPRCARPRDESRPEYRDIAGAAARVRDAHPQVRFLTTIVVGDDAKCVDRRRRRGGRRASTRRSAARSSPTTSCSRPSPAARPTSTCSTSTSGASG